MKISERPVPKPRKHLLMYSLEDKNVSTVSEAPRKQKEPSKEKEVPEDTDTEVENTDKKEHKSETGPWPLKRVKRITGKETLRSSAERPKQKQITPEPFKSEVHLQEHLGQFESCATWNGWTERQKAQQLFMCQRCHPSKG